VKETPSGKPKSLPPHTGGDAGGDEPLGSSKRHAHGIDAESKTANLKRLKRIEGQIRGLHKMVEEDRYCPDIITQIAAWDGNCCGTI